MPFIDVSDRFLHLVHRVRGWETVIAVYSGFEDRGSCLLEWWIDGGAWCCAVPRRRLEDLEADAAEWYEPPVPDPRQLDLLTWRPQQPGGESKDEEADSAG